MPIEWVMLKEFLLDAAHALDRTRHPVARNVAGLLATIDVDDDWQISQEVPSLAALPMALAAPGCHRATRTLAGIADKLAWTERTRTRPSGHVDIRCSVAIVGPQGMITDERFKFGIYLQPPGMFYPAHRHEAEELYFVLSGKAQWEKDGAGFEPVAGGDLIHHAPYQAHAMRTQDEPLLALWSWTGNLSNDTYSFVTD
jgi:mannose-6-phosphate isomerase-like protein (cupin superfamily)